MAYSEGILNEMRKQRQNTRPSPNRFRDYLDVEQMSVRAKRHYLSHRLTEVEWLIESVLFNRQKHMLDISPLDLVNTDRAIWERILDLSYLEASRQAILQTLLDLSQPAGITWPAPNHTPDLPEGAHSRGFISGS